MNSRLEKLRSQFPSLKVDAFLITFAPHLRYMSGFSGSSGIGLVTRDASYFLTDGRYAGQVKTEIHGWKTFITQRSLFDEMYRKKLLQPGTRVGFDGNTVTYTQFTQLKQALPKIHFLPKADCIERIAIVKDESEIEKIRRAVDITDRVFTEILPLVKQGVSELDIAAEISYRQRKHGSEADAFESIVASGERNMAGPSGVRMGWGAGSVLIVACRASLLNVGAWSS